MHRRVRRQPQDLQPFVVGQLFVQTPVQEREYGLGRTALGCRLRRPAQAAHRLPIQTRRSAQYVGGYPLRLGPARSTTSAAFACAVGAGPHGHRVVHGRADDRVDEADGTVNRVTIEFDETQSDQLLGAV